MNPQALDFLMYSLTLMSIIGLFTFFHLDRKSSKNEKPSLKFL